MLFWSKDCSDLNTVLVLELFCSENCSSFENCAVLKPVPMWTFELTTFYVLNISIIVLKQLPCDRESKVMRAEPTSMSTEVIGKIFG
jgi:hypothetical protein